MWAVSFATTGVARNLKDKFDISGFKTTNYLKNIPYFTFRHIR